MKINPQIEKYAACITAAAAVFAVSAYALFLLWHISIIYGISHILPSAVLLEITALTILSFIFLYRFFFKKTSLAPVLIFVFLLWILPKLTFIICIESEYSSIEKEFSDFAEEKKASGNSKAALAWNISKKYLESFSSSQNNIKIPVPVRCIYEENIVLKANSVVYCYLFCCEGLEKLTAADKRGNCSEYALAVAYISNRTAGVQARIVVISGCDHKIAEVKSDDGWYVIDPLKTTPDYPVLISDYKSELLKKFPEIYEKVVSVRTKNGVSLAKSHGFLKIT